MPIKVACRCGQAFAAKDELAGKTVKCPKCQAPLVIGSPPPTAAANVSLNSLLDEEGFTSHAGIRCAKCNEAIPPGGMICIACGHNMQTGMSVIPGARTKTKAPKGHGEATESILNRAAEELKKAPPPKDESAGGMAMSYVLTIVMFTITATVATGGFFLFRTLEASSNRPLMSGLAMQWIGSGLSALGHIWISVVGFFESGLTGILCLLVPFYSLIYGFMKGHRIQVFLIILGCIMTIGGLLLAMFASQSDPSKPVGQVLEYGMDDMVAVLGLATGFLRI